MSWDKRDPQSEAEYLLSMHGGESGMPACLQLLSGQFSVLQTRSQLLLTLATLVLTITGFSGPRIAASGLFARVGMSIGLVLTLVAIIILMLNLRIRWLTEFHGATPRDTLTAIIHHREAKRRVYFAIITLLILGLGHYVIAFLMTGASVAM